MARVYCEGAAVVSWFSVSFLRGSGSDPQEIHIPSSIVHLKAIQLFAWRRTLIPQAAHRFGATAVFSNICPNIEACFPTQKERLPYP